MAQAVRNRRYDPYRHVEYAYEGSAVRVLEPDEQVVRRPYERPRQRVAVRPQVQVRQAGKVAPFAVVGFAAVAVLAVLFLMSMVRISAISSEVVSLEAQMTQLKSEEATLRARYELAYDLAAIEVAVTADGSMGRPQPGQMVYVDLTEPDSVVVYDNGQETAGGFLDGAREIMRNVLAYF